MPAPATDNKRLPDFLCVGIEKCGTTTLYDLLSQHPQIGLSSHKETHFFNTHWDKGMAWYAEKFAHLDPDCKRIGEITPAYHRFPEVIPRIRQTLGAQTKIIMLLREPRRRAFSHYIHDFANQLEVTDLVYKRYLATTRYAPVLENYFSAFGKDNCLVSVFEEEMLVDQQRFVNRICDFLGVTRHAIKPVHSNPSSLPVAVRSPATKSTVIIEGCEFAVPANSVLICTGSVKNTRIVPGLADKDAQALIEQVSKAVSFIPALKSSIVFEQNVQADLDAVEQLLGRRIESWHQPLGDLQARFARAPAFIPAVE